MGIGYSSDCIDIGTKIHYQLDKRSDTKKDYIITDFKHKNTDICCLQDLPWQICDNYR